MAKTRLFPDQTCHLHNFSLFDTFSSHYWTALSKQSSFCKNLRFPGK